MTCSRERRPEDGPATALLVPREDDAWGAAWKELAGTVDAVWHMRRGSAPSSRCVIQDKERRRRTRGLVALHRVERLLLRPPSTEICRRAPLALALRRRRHPRACAVLVAIVVKAGGRPPCAARAVPDARRGSVGTIGVALVGRDMSEEEDGLAGEKGWRAGGAGEWSSRVRSIEPSSAWS